MSSVTPTGLAALFTLVLQNSSLVLLMRTAVTSGSGFLASTAVCCDEMFKLCLCTVVMAGYYVFKVPADAGLELPRIGDQQIAKVHNSSSKSLRGLFDFFAREVFGHGTLEIMKLALPALAYTLQKNCLYLAITHLEAAVYMVTYQAKILTTALFSCLLLRKPMSRMQVFALCMLMTGVNLVQVSSMEEKKQASPDPSSHTEQKPLLGLFGVTVACMTSGFSGVWFELVLKTPSFDHSRVDKALAKEFAMWVRNIHLAMFALVAALIGAFVKDGAAISKGGFLQAYTHITWATVILEASGGIIVAIVIKYTDNILKNFATAISIVTATAVSALFLGFHVTPMFVAGTLLVLIAVTLYQRNPPTSDNTCQLCLCGKGEAK
eukprot:TRINITY_DN43532_c0_g1_i1.p1 TRINITY_DN43532_c0_g1~~TRINITY_DN43532_c0_g1_i1.p1  ORF type:complete len:388 (-),score=60.35 TRINITY_DN43532_c0_g1_i1:33-1169(-)